MKMITYLLQYQSESSMLAGFNKLYTWLQRSKVIAKFSSSSLKSPEFSYHTAFPDNMQLALLFYPCSQSHRLSGIQKSTHHCCLPPSNTSVSSYYSQTLRKDTSAGEGIKARQVSISDCSTSRM